MTQETQTEVAPFTLERLRANIPFPTIRLVEDKTVKCVVECYCFATDECIEVHARVQDALLVGGAVQEIEDVVVATKNAIIARASKLAPDGFIFPTDTTIVKPPNRYSDKRGTSMWGGVMRLFDEIEVEA